MTLSQSLKLFKKLVVKYDAEPHLKGHQRLK